jgi:aminoglycoside N3'-acetyltransferase
MIDQDQLVKDLYKLGVQVGDTLYVRSGLKEIGNLKRPAKETVLNGFLNAVGPTGNLVAPAFSPLRIFQPIVNAPPKFNAPTYAGALSRAMLKHAGACRSAHPTHSFVAIGPKAGEIMADHDLSTACFEPMRKIIDLDGKMLLVGCVKSSPGFSTVHLAQYDLGLSQRHYMRFVNPVQSSTGDKSTEMRFPPERPGCSKGFGKFYQDYIEDGNFITGRVGNAWAICVGAHRAYESDLTILQDRPLSVLCDNPACISCRMTRGYNKRAIPGAWTRFGIIRFKKLLKRIVQPS